MNHVAFLYDHVLDTGGVEKHLLTILRRADRQRFRFSIIARTSPSFAASAQAFGCAVLPFNALSAFNPFTWFELARLLADEQVNLLHIHAPIAAISGRMAALLARIPSLTTVHLPTAAYHGTGQTPRSRAGRWLYVQTDRLLNHALPYRSIYVSESVRDADVQAGHLPARSSLVIPNGIDLPAYRQPVDRAAVRDGIGASQGRCAALFTGRLDPQKGLDVLLDVLVRLPGKLPDWEVWLAGSGPLDESLRARVQALDLSERVRFLGQRADIPALLAASDVFVLPSLYEALPYSLLEAMAAGKACLASAVGDCAVMLDDGRAGLVVAPGSAAELAHGLARLIANPTLRESLGAAARARSEAYSDVEIVRRIEEVYDELINTKGSA